MWLWYAIVFTVGALIGCVPLAILTSELLEPVLGSLTEAVVAGGLLIAVHGSLRLGFELGQRVDLWLDQRRDAGFGLAVIAPPVGWFVALYLLSLLTRWAGL